MDSVKQSWRADPLQLSGEIIFNAHSCEGAESPRFVIFTKPEAALLMLPV